MRQPQWETNKKSYIKVAIGCSQDEFTTSVSLHYSHKCPVSSTEWQRTSAHRHSSFNEVLLASAKRNLSNMTKWDLFHIWCWWISPPPAVWHGPAATLRLPLKLALRLLIYIAPVRGTSFHLELFLKDAVHTRSFAGDSEQEVKNKQHSDVRGINISLLSFFFFSSREIQACTLHLCPGSTAVHHSNSLCMNTHRAAFHSCPKYTGSLK